MDAAGNVYVTADSFNVAVEEIVAANGTVKVLMQDPPFDGLNNAVHEIVAATATVKSLATGFDTPQGIAVDANGRVYVVDSGALWGFTP